MKAKQFVSGILLAFSITQVIGQANSKKIVGIIFEKNASGTKPPIPGASVFVPGIGSSTTDSKGYYSIDLSQCSSCHSGENLKVYVNSSVGYAEADYVIQNNSSMKPFDIGISENSKLSINGIVKNKKSGKLLQGIKVTIVIQNYNLTIPSALTNESGIFQIIIRKEGIVNMQAIQIVFSDATNSKYKDLEKVVFVNQYDPIKVEMEECEDCGDKFDLGVNTFMKSGIKVEQGDLVIIKASGQMRVGDLIGNSGPEGVPNNRGVLGISLKDYNFFKTWNHAVLVFRFGENDEWKYYEDRKENKHLVQKSGYIEFAINDNKQDDNSGSYKVEITIRK